MVRSRIGLNASFFIRWLNRLRLLSLSRTRKNRKAANRKRKYRIGTEETTLTESQMLVARGKQGADMVRNVGRKHIEMAAERVLESEAGKQLAEM